MSLCVLLFCVGVVLLHCALHGRGVPTVTINQGKLTGTYMYTREGRIIQAFLGIPYAQPPIGFLRFKSPQPAIPWQGELKANTDANCCIQANPLSLILFSVPFLPRTIGSEDCLYLNVYTPKASTQLSLPVMVFIHGGALESGSAHKLMYGPDFLLDEDIVLVVIQYRLGLLGFLSTGDEVVSGNMGLKDQRLALRWVRDNIDQFGGNPSAVTIFGESAGAVSVHYHMIFTANEGLFRAAISQSGSALNPWTFYRPQDVSKNMQQLATLSNCPSEPAEFVACLREMSGERIVKLLRTLKDINTGSDLMDKFFTSIVLEPACVEDRFVTENPWNRNTTIPWLTGVNDKEMILYLLDMQIDRSDVKIAQLDATFDKLMPHYLNYDMSNQDFTEVAPRVRNFYLDSKHITRRTFNHTIDAFSDPFFNYGAREAVRRRSGAITYFYYFTYRGIYSLPKLVGSSPIYGVSHVDDLYYFFPILFGQGSLVNRPISKQLIKMWTNFATHLNPTPDNSLNFKWNPVSHAEVNYLDIGKNGFANQKAFLPDRMEFWSSMPFPNRNETIGPVICRKAKQDQWRTIMKW